MNVVIGIHDITNPKNAYGLDGSPRPTQTLSANYIAFDPKYESNTGKYDIAMIFIRNFTYNTYTRAICPDQYYSIKAENYDDCVLTGWGKGMLNDTPIKL